MQLIINKPIIRTVLYESCGLLFMRHIVHVAGSVDVMSHHFGSENIPAKQE